MKAKLLATAVFFGCAGIAASIGLAQDGGPDYLRVSGVSPGSALNLRAQPSIEAPIIGRMPANSDGLRNLGCSGGLSFAEYENASAAERAAGARRRWCRVEFRGTEGWAAGWYLVEGGPPG